MIDEKGDMEDIAKTKADLIVEAALSRKVFDPALLKMDETAFADYFFICSCRSNRQAQAAAEHIIETAKKQGGFRPLGVEGQNRGHWILLDFGEVVAHIFYEPVRKFYDLETLWLDARRVRIEAGEEYYTGGESDWGEDDWDEESI